MEVGCQKLILEIFPPQNKNRKRNSPEIGYSNYNPDIDNKNK